MTSSDNHLKRKIQLESEFKAVYSLLSRASVPEQSPSTYDLRC